MFKYAVVDIAGKQYTVSPNQVVTVDSLGDAKTLSCDKVLLLVDDSGVQVGTPYLKDGIDFDVVDTGKAKKIRVAKFHAKANFRRVRGFRRTISKVQAKVSGEAAKGRKTAAKPSEAPVETSA